MQYLKQIFLAIITLLALTGCERGEIGERCDQRWRIYFNAEMMAADGERCTTHDFDADGISAWADRDDRCSDQVVSVDVDEPWCPGWIVGDFDDCRDYDAVDGRFTGEYSYGCITQHRKEQLDDLCADFAAGKWVTFDEAYTCQGREYFAQETLDFYEFCPQQDIEKFEALPEEAMPVYDDDLPC